MTLTLYHFSFPPSYKKYQRWDTGDVIWNLLKLQKIFKKNRIFQRDFNELVIIPGIFRVTGLLVTPQNARLLLRPIWLFLLDSLRKDKILSESVSLFTFKKSHGITHIKFKIMLKPNRSEPVLWNYAWRNGRSCAFRQIQSEFLQKCIL